MKKKLGALLISALLIPGLASAVEAEDQCHTAGTKWDGDPRSCSGQVCITAYRIQQSSATVVKTNGYGSKSECHQPFIVDTEEENGGRTTRITKMCANLFAKSPSGMNNAGERGTVRCKLTANSWDD